MGRGREGPAPPELGLAAAVAQAAVAAGMGDGAAERDRGPKRREEPGGRSGRHEEHRGTEDLRVDKGGASPREIAGTSASSPAGSRESGGDSDGQQALGETDHCRRILVRGKGTAAALIAWATKPPFLWPPTSLQRPSHSSYRGSFIRQFIL